MPLELDEPDPLDVLIPSAFSVAAPTMPSGVRPFFFWKAITAFFVPAPNTPSMLPV